MSEENETAAEEPPVLIDDSMSQSIGNIALALSKAQGLMTGAVKNKTNPFFKASYADLSAYIDVARESLAKNEIAVIQTTGNTEKAVIIKTMIAHSSGEWIRSALSMPLVKFDVQAVGSAISYGRRYALAAMLNIAQEDDDGSSATAAPKPAKKALLTGTAEYTRAVEAYRRDGNLDNVKEHMSVSKEVAKLIKEAANVA